MTTLYLPGEQPTTDDGPARVSLVTLAAGRGASSPALTRVVSHGPARRGPARVAVAAFQSSV
ncbi:hypothetical protein SGFS_065490 [Streptomyces graminofaciens]|uniref:Uncharacterized protein n=1 Tax=Streptomyces graminofaciens TaxID=68212 RepID=A0ABN5VRS8_9ACTN|nr:hypothetical protein SGFS_065490 [Streptomyces graminofaciens]